MWRHHFSQALLCLQGYEWVSGWEWRAFMQLLGPHESWLVGGMVERLHSFTQLHQVGPAFPHSAQFCDTASLLQPRPTWPTPAPGSRRPFQSFGGALCLRYSLPTPPPPRNWFDLKCGAVSVEKKNTRWKDARQHPHSHTTPMLTRHQLDRFQEVWHLVSLFLRLTSSEPGEEEWRREGAGKKVTRWGKRGAV